jgi:DNA-binding transcriptional ArsR family regulator
VVGPAFIAVVESTAAGEPGRWVGCAARCLPRQVLLRAASRRTGHDGFPIKFAGGIELTVGEIADRCALKPSTASEHLSLLRRGGLVISRKDGKQVCYRADGATMDQRLSALQTYLANCCLPDCAG